MISFGRAPNFVFCPNFYAFRSPSPNAKSRWDLYTNSLSNSLLLIKNSIHRLYNNYTRLNIYYTSTIYFKFKHRTTAHYPQVGSRGSHPSPYHIGIDPRTYRPNRTDEPNQAHRLLLTRASKGAWENRQKFLNHRTPNPASKRKR